MVTIDTPRTDPTTASATTPFSRGRFAIVVSAAAVVNLVVFFVGSAAGASMVVNTGATTQLIALLPVVATVVPLALAGVVTWLVARRLPVLRVVAGWAGAVIALCSTAAPLIMSSDAATGLALAVMHVVAGVAWFVAIMTGRNSEVR